MPVTIRTMYGSAPRNARAAAAAHILRTAMLCIAAASCVEAAEGEAQALDVDVQTIAPEPMSGQVISLSNGDGLHLRTSDGREQHVPAADLVHVAIPHKMLAPGTAGIAVRIGDEDEVYGDIISGDDQVLLLDTRDLGRLSLRLETIRSVMRRKGDVELAGRWLRGLSHRVDEDTLLLSNGDVLRGFVHSMDADGLTMESPMGETRVPMRLLYAVRLASKPLPDRRVIQFELTFSSTGRVTVSELQWKDGALSFRWGSQEHRRIDAHRLVRVEVRGGRWVRLSRLTPSHFEHTPMLSLPWTYARNRNVLGWPIQVGGYTYERGFGVHSRSSLILELQGEYRQFVTRFGIDDRSGPWADVDVALLVDGERRYVKKGVRRGTLYGPVRLDVSGAAKIEMLTDFGRNGDLQDRFNWIDPALIR